MFSDERFSLAKNVVSSAGEVALEMFSDGTFAFKHKAEGDSLTAADLLVEDYIKKRIFSQFPNDVIVSEESAFHQQPVSSRYVWLIDPIDGTHSFSTGIAGWCISIAAVKGGEIVFGVIYDPVRKECFSAYKGKGAFLNTTPISLVSSSNIKEYAPRPYLAFGTSYRDDKDRISRALTRLILLDYLPYRNGSAALCMAYVAANRLLAFLELNLHQWDVAAGYILLREAGLEVEYSFSDIDTATTLICGRRDVVEEIKNKMI